MQCVLSGKFAKVIGGSMSPELFNLCAHFPRFKRDGDAWIFQSSPVSLYRLSLAAPDTEFFGEAADIVSKMQDAFAARHQIASEQGYINGELSLLDGLQFKTDPWAHQAGAIYYGLRHPSPYFNMGMGTGKSLVTVGIISNAGHRHTLILCPKRVIGVWPREFSRHCSIPVHVEALDEGTVKEKLRRAKIAIEYRTEMPVVIVINYESARQAEFSKWATSRSWDCIVGDEMHRAKDHAGVTGKMMRALGLRAKHRIALSGTPMPNNPLDLWAQCAFLDQGVFGDSYFRFRARYAKLGFFKQVEEFQNLEELNELFALVQYYVSSDVLSLPPFTNSMVKFALRPETMRKYHELRRDLATQFCEGTVTAANALVKAIRFQQITSGFIVDDVTKEVRDLEDNAKEMALRETLADTSPNEPVVVFARYKNDLKRVEQVAIDMGRKYGEVSGQRCDLDKEACMPAGFGVFGVNMQSGGVGVDLTRAPIGIYYSLSHSLGEFDQSLARIRRPGQRSATRFIHLVAAGTVDEEIYEAIESKREVNSAVLSYLRSSVSGKHAA